MPTTVLAILIFFSSRISLRRRFAMKSSLRGVAPMPLTMTATSSPSAVDALVKDLADETDLPAVQW